MFARPGAAGEVWVCVYGTYEWERAGRGERREGKRLEEGLIK